MLKNYLSILALALSPVVASAQLPDTPASQMETLTRGLVAVPATVGNFVSWRLLGTDNVTTTAFNLYRDGTLIAGNLQGGTCYTDTLGTSTSSYSIETLVSGQVVENSSAVMPWADKILQVKLQQPDASVTNNDSKYSPNDISVGDVDGDGEYELIVKWDPCGSMPSQDNSKTGKTGNVVLDCYKLDGTRLWSINLGPNIRAGAHYTQFLVYDFDGDDKAEVICKTAPWSKDGKGNYVSAAADDADIKSCANTTSLRNSKGYILSGPEFLTVFNGETGAAIHTIYYNPNRAGGVGGSADHPAKSFWGDNYGNRADRFLATVAYLGGRSANPSAVMCRGYYTRAYVWAVDFDGKKLSTRWLHASTSTKDASLTDAAGNTTTKTYSTNTAKTGYSYTLYGNGNHNLACADVDGDGCDEIIYGSAALDQDGSLLYAVGFGHGDAMHLGDLLPDRPGLEVFTVHEEKHPAYGWDIHDAATGEVIHSETGSGDNGRGMSADVDTSNRGYEFWSQTDKSVRSCLTADTLSTKSQSINFRIYWDGDPYDELFDGRYSSSTLLCNPKITKYNGSASVQELNIDGKALTTYGNAQTCNTTKATPCLQADLFGDWREELILWSADDYSTLDIFTTTIPTDYRVPTLMHDHTYRMGITWQQSAYNQPPHLGYYLPDYIRSFTPAAINGTTVTDRPATATPYYDLSGRNLGTDSSRLQPGIYINNGRKVVVGL